MPKVSIILPNYNHAEYLPKRLESIQNQTFKDWELILLDDCSTDGSHEILRQFADGRPEIQTVFNKKNSGSPFYQWNRGAAMANGDYLWFAESDDFCDDKLLEKLVPILDKYSAVSIAYAQTYLVNEQNEILNSYSENLRFIYKSEDWNQDFIKNGEEACRDWLLFHNPIPNASGALIRRKSFEKAGGAPTDMKLNGDWFLYSKLLIDNDLAFCAEHLNYFRVHPKTQRERARQDATAYFEIIRINDFIKKNVAKSEKNATTAMQEVASWWIGSLPYQNWNKKFWQQNRKLYTYFKDYKNALWWHIFLTFVIVAFRKILFKTGLLKPAKALRKKLFPNKYFEY